MAMAEGPRSPHDRHGRRRPFSSWVKRLTNLKSLSSDSHNADGSSSKKVHGNTITHKNKKNVVNTVKNNPYPFSGTLNSRALSHRNEEMSVSEASDRYYPISQDYGSLPDSTDGQPAMENCAKSAAPTLSTNGDTTVSETAYSKAGTMATGAGGVGGGEGSTFSSPAPSVRSLTTTLTTVQSAAPSTHIHGPAQNHNYQGATHLATSPVHGSASASQQVQFSHQFPTSASAIPPYLMSNQPNTYIAATANNLLTDNASLLTLASSSKRRRRNSLDTNASVRALAPSSIFGGSRESLPISVLSGHAGGEPSNASAINAPGVLGPASVAGLASAERASIYSSSGVAPMVSASDRSSFIASGKQISGAGDSGSVRSGVFSHTRNDSATGSVGGPGPSATSAIPNSAGPTGRVSRRSSGWGGLAGAEEDNDSTHHAPVDEAALVLESSVTEENSGDN